MNHIVNSDRKVIIDFNRIVLRNPSNGNTSPVELELVNVESSSSIEVDLNGLALTNSKIPNMNFHLKGSHVHVRGAKQTIRVMDIDTNGLNLQDITLNYLSSYCTLVGSDSGELYLQNANIGNIIFQLRILFSQLIHKTT